MPRLRSAADEFDADAGPRKRVDALARADGVGEKASRGARSAAALAGGAAAGPAEGGVALNGGRNAGREEEEVHGCEGRGDGPEKRQEFNGKDGRDSKEDVLQA